MVRVVGSGGGGLPWRTMTKAVTLRPGVETSLEFPLPPRLLNGVLLSLNDAPEGISIKNATPKPNGIAVVLSVQPDKAKPGLKGNLILEAYRDVAANPPANNRNRRRQPLGTLPAIPFEVVP